MRKVLDLGELHKQLRQTEEHEPHFDEELNPYLLDTVLPQLEGEEPIRLEQIDFDQFDEEDHGRRYFERSHEDLKHGKSAGEPREIEQAHGYAWRLHGDHLG